MILNSKVRNTHNLNLSHLNEISTILQNAGISVCRDKNTGIENAGIQKEGIGKCRDENAGIGIPGIKLQG